MSEPNTSEVVSVEENEGSRATGFRRRLKANTLTPDDHDALNLARAIKEARAQNVSMTALAKQLKMNVARLHSFAGRGIARVAFEWLDTIENTSDDKLRARLEREQTERFENLRPKALKFYEDALSQREVTDPETGATEVVWTSPAMAMWATEQITKGAGWNQPKTVRPSVIQLNVSFINAQASMQSEDDESMPATPLDPAKDTELSAEQFHHLDDGDEE